MFVFNYISALSCSDEFLNWDDHVPSVPGLTAAPRFVLTNLCASSLNKCVKEGKKT